MIPFFKKKKKNLGYYIIIDFNTASKEIGVGNSFNKKIYHMWNGRIVKIESYSDIKINSLIKDRVFIIDRTMGQIVPKETTFVPMSKGILGQLQISKLFYR